MAARARHVIFDLDGVVVDSEPTHERANAEYLAGLGATLDPELAAAMLGRRVRDLTDAIAKQTGLPPEEVFAGREAVFWRLLEQAPLRPMPGLRPALARLTGAGLPLAVASSGTRGYVAHVLQRLGVAGAFAAVVSGEEVARRDKISNRELVRDEARDVDAVLAEHILCEAAAIEAARIRAAAQVGRPAQTERCLDDGIPIGGGDSRIGGVRAVRSVGRVALWRA